MNTQLPADGDSFPVERFDQPAGRIAHAFLVEQEVTAGSFDACRIGQGHGRMNDRIGVLQARLHDARCRLHAGVDILYQPQHRIRFRAR